MDINKELAQLGISQTRLCQILDVQRSFINKAVKDQEEPLTRTRLAVERALQIAEENALQSGQSLVAGWWLSDAELHTLMHIHSAGGEARCNGRQAFRVGRKSLPRATVRRMISRGILISTPPKVTITQKVERWLSERA